MVSLKILDMSVAEDREAVQALQNTLRGGGLVAAEESSSLDVHRIVSDILAEVRQGGDKACAQLANRLDGAALDAQSLRVPANALEAAHRAADQEFLALVRRAADNIRAYQEQILHRDPPPLIRGGRRLGVRYTAMDRVGVYVPGGRALYPSTVLMTVVPAQVAGVREVVMASPPTGGAIHPLALALAYELGVTEVVQLGGAVAVAALAYGTESIPRVDKIVGPGNAFVAEAKRLLFGRVGIDSVAGPSEVVIVADQSANPAWVAADLLAQAEHNPGSAVLITPDRGLAEQVVAAVDDQLMGLSRAGVTRSALEKYSAVLVSADLVEACKLATEFAAEHLQLMTADDAFCLDNIRHAGAIFIGGHTPVPLGDYFAGPSHVLPTSGTARFFGPLSCNDFLKATSMVEYEAQALEEDRRDVERFATYEGLTAHAAAVSRRFID